MAAGFDSLKIQLGDQLLPVEGKVLDALTKLVSSPAVTQGIQDFGTALAGLFTDENIAGAEKFLNDVVPQIKDFATSVLPPPPGVPTAPHDGLIAFVGEQEKTCCPQCPYQHVPHAGVVVAADGTLQPGSENDQRAYRYHNWQSYSQYSNGGSQG